MPRSGPSLYGPEQPRRRPVGASPRQVRRDSPVKLPEGADLVFAETLQAVLSSLLDQAHVPGPFLTLFAGHGSRLQARAAAAGRMTGGFHLVEPDEVFVGGAGDRLAIAFKGEAERLEDG